MKITNDSKKIEIIERLVKDGAIDFSEALKLLEEPEEVKYYPPVNPFQPYGPFEPNPFGPIVTYDATELRFSTKKN